MRVMRWIDRLEEDARARLPEPVHRYFRQGAGRGRTAAEAEAAWDALRFRPRVLRDVTAVSTATSVLGHQLRTPVCVAPSTLQRQADDEGEVATMRGAVAAGTLTCVSSNTGVPFTRLDPDAPWWVQAYVLADRGLTKDLLDAARSAGASAVVLTADTPVVGRKDDTGPTVWQVIPPEHLGANLGLADLPEERLAKAKDLTPDAIEWLAGATGLPVVVKGVLRADDARTTVAAGACAVWVSNHGGRQLDGAVPTAVALPEVAEAVAGTGVEVYVDGGIRRGEHVLAALALGARAVFVGRPVLWALATDGADGVRRLVADLTDELAHALTLAGATSPDDVAGDLVVPPR